LHAHEVINLPDEAGGKGGYTCPAALHGCTDRKKHLLPDCEIFKKMSVRTRWFIIDGGKICTCCLKVYETVAECKECNSRCDIFTATRGPNKMLLYPPPTPGQSVQSYERMVDAWEDPDYLEASVQMAEIMESEVDAEKDIPIDPYGYSRESVVLENGAVVVGTAASGSVPIRLMIQSIKVNNGSNMRVMWDCGSQVSLITHACAKMEQMASSKTNLHIKGVGQASCRSSLIYAVPLEDKDGNVVFLKAYGVDVLTSPVDGIKTLEILKKFKNANKSQIEDEGGEVDLLIGMDRADLIPVPVETYKRLTLFRSQFRTGWLVASNVPCPTGTGRQPQWDAQWRSAPIHWTQGSWSSSRRPVRTSLATARRLSL
jgi:hypothetical protein